MMTRTLKFIPGTLLLTVALSVQAATTIQGLIDKITSQVIRPLIVLLFAIATLVFIWGIILYVIAQAQDEKKLADAKRMMLWGIIGLTVMAGAWGIVQILCSFFFETSCASAAGSGGYQSPDFGGDLF